MFYFVLLCIRMFQVFNKYIMLEYMKYIIKTHFICMVARLNVLIGTLANCSLITISSLFKRQLKI